MSAEPLFIILTSGEHEKIQMAGMIASVAAVSERPVEVFVSMNAMFAFRKDRSDYQGGEFSKLMKDKNAPDAIELFQQGRMLGDLKVYPCSMAMDISGWQESELVEDLFEPPAGLTKFLSDAENGHLVTI
jgi:peroxiredoxin family protein